MTPLALLLLLLGGLRSDAQVARAAGPPREPSEHEVKAAFVFHFAQLVTWPVAEATTAEPLTVAVVGRDPFAGWLERTLAGRTVRERPLRVVHADGLSALDPAPDIVVLGELDTREARRTLAALKGRPVLTVSAAPGFARAGGMIEFRITPDQRVGFDINAREVERAGLRMSSQLLRLARIVEEQP